MEIPAAGDEVAEVLPAVCVQGNDLPVQDDLFDRQLHTDPVAELVEPLQVVPPLGLEPARLAGDVQDAPVAVVLGLEEPSRIVKRVARGVRRIGAKSGRVTAVRGLMGAPGQPEGLPMALPTRRT